MEPKKPVPSEILELIGAIVLSTQDAEKFMKLLLPFTDRKDPSLTGVLKRHNELKLRTFGALMNEFIGSSNSISSDLQHHLDVLVDRRNKIVHHFEENFGFKLQSKGSQDAISALKEQLNNVNAFRDALAQMMLQLLEALRDTTFKGTIESQAMGELCELFRKRAS